MLTPTSLPQLNFSFFSPTLPAGCSPKFAFQSTPLALSPSLGYESGDVSAFQFPSLPLSNLSQSDSEDESDDSDDDTEDDCGRKRKTRTCFTIAQLTEMEKLFNSNKYLSTNRRLELANRINLHEKQVKTWFQNRRMKEKRQKKAEDEMRNSIPTGGFDLTSYELGRRHMMAELSSSAQNDAKDLKEAALNKHDSSNLSLLPEASFYQQNARSRRYLEGKDHVITTLKEAHSQDLGWQG
nr:hypothetical protein BaRGS_018433 [Batillaria attramentaria]